MRAMTRIYYAAKFYVLGTASIEQCWDAAGVLVEGFTFPEEVK